MTFSRRTGWDLAPNELARRLVEKRAREEEFLDLTESNPTRCGLSPPEKKIRDALAEPGVDRYEPDPRGMGSAREAIALYYRERGRTVAASDLLLTASTSEAYGWLFKLLCDPGDRVLVPVPGYPLFEHLASLESVEVVGYPQSWDGSWHLDLPSLRAAAADPRLRALVVVNPGNPSGAYLKAAEAEAVLDLCAERGLALICDEVFSDYAFEGAPADRVESMAGETRALVFALSGFSKVLALPQWKLGWIAVSGPSSTSRIALERLEMIADTWLSVSTSAQLGAARLLATRPGVQRVIRDRVRRNCELLSLLVAAPSPVSLLQPEGGWAAVLRVPATRTDEQWALALLDAGVLVQPGYFFDFAAPGHLVVSLLPEPDCFAEAVGRMRAVLTPAE